MAEVTGNIGNQEVALNNAATEATLRLLLQSSLSANKQSLDNITKIATKAGLDPVAVQAANSNLKNVSETSKSTTGAFYKLGLGTALVEEGFKKVDSAISPLIGKLIDGTDKASDVFGQFARLGGPVGLVAQQFERLAKFQEENLKSYQQITSAGANFGGNLTLMRNAAASTYMTLDEFTRVVKTNAPVFAKMGGTVDEGARAWAKASNKLLSSEAGNNLRALGYTSEQVNQGMLDYISVSGGRSKKELQNTDALVKSSALYMQELDELASITGKSREEIAKKAKAELEAADFQIFLAGKSKEEREVIEANVKRAGALYGQGGMDIAKANAMGVAVQGEAGKKLTALSSQTSDGIKKDLELRKKYGNDSELIGKNEAETRKATSDNLMRFGGAVGSYGGVFKGIEEAGTQAAKDSLLGRKGIDDQYKELAKERATREKSQASAAVEAQKAVQELGQRIMALLIPAVNALTPVMNSILKGMGAVVEKLVEFKNVTIGLLAALGTYWALQKAQNIIEIARSAQTKGGRGGAGGMWDATKSVLSGTGVLGSKTNPLYVIVVGEGVGGLEDLEKGKKGSKTGKDTPGNRADRLAKVSKGRALQSAGKSALTSLKGAGILGGLVTAGMSVSDFMDVSEKEKKGEIKPEEAKVQKGGIVGEAAGGLGGAAAGAAAGAALGSVVPILGTAIGGIVGGLIGGFGGGMLGKFTGESLAPKLANGGIVSRPTSVIAGEAGPEIIAPTRHFENLQRELETLNKNTIAMIKELKDIVSHTQQSVSATKSLGGDLFKF